MTDAYQTALGNYELIRERTQPHMPDPQAPGYDPILFAIGMALRASANELMSELRISWKALESDRELPAAYESELHGRCYMAFRALRAAAEYAERLPERADVYADAQRQSELVEAEARRVLAEKYAMGREDGSLTVHFTAADGYGAVRSASVGEVVDALADAGLLTERMEADHGAS